MADNRWRYPSCYPFVSPSLRLSVSVSPIPLHFLYPLPGIHQSFYPRSDFFIFSSRYIMRPVPGRQGPFDMRHNGQMPSIIRRNTRYRMGRTVGVAGIRFIAIGHAYMVVFFCFREIELALPMRDPYPEALTGK